MLNSLKQAGKEIGRELNRAWENLSEGWRELLSRGSESLTHFSRSEDDVPEDGRPLATFPRWSLLAGEVEETPNDIVVRVEVPGMDKEDCSITIEGNVLHLSGEKHFERETRDSTYHVMERAIPLPRHVNIDQAVARCHNGVLTVRLPKESSGKAKNITVT